MRHALVIACTLSALALGGCSSPTYSCAAPDGSACSDYIAGFSLAQAQMACAEIAGYAFSSTAACPVANRVGRCTLTDSVAGYTATIRVSTYAPAETTAQAMAECPPAVPGPDAGATGADAGVPTSGVIYEFQAD